MEHTLENHFEWVFEVKVKEFKDKDAAISKLQDEISKLPKCKQRDKLKKLLKTRIDESARIMADLEKAKNEIRSRSGKVLDLPKSLANSTNWQQKEELLRQRSTAYKLAVSLKITRTSYKQRFEVATVSYHDEDANDLGLLLNELKGLISDLSIEEEKIATVLYNRVKG